MLITELAEIPPGAAAEVVARAMREQPAVFRECGPARKSGARSAGCGPSRSLRGGRASRGVTSDLFCPRLHGSANRIADRILRTRRTSTSKATRNRRHHFVVARRLGLLEQSLDHHVVPNAIQRLGKVSEDLRPGEGSGVALPAVDESGQRRRRTAPRGSPPEIGHLPAPKYSSARSNDPEPCDGEGHMRGTQPRFRELEGQTATPKADSTLGSKCRQAGAANTSCPSRRLPTRRCRQRLENRGGPPQIGVVADRHARCASVHSRKSPAGEKRHLLGEVASACRKCRQALH